MTKAFPILFALTMIAVQAFSQVDTLGQVNELSNSFASEYANRYPDLKYSYDGIKQVHNYSGNWDFDGDRKSDSVFFVGNGGAHLYFHLQIKLSSETSARDYSYVLSDLPFLESFDFLTSKPDKFHRLFVVHDFNNDGVLDLFIRNDGYLRGDGSYEAPKALKAKGVSSSDLVFCLERKKFVIKDWKVFQ